MSQCMSFGRLASSALTSVRLGTVPVSRFPALAHKNYISPDDDLHKSFRKLNISPLEAQLTAQVLSNGINEYRLPSVFKPISITVPSLYNGAILEKELPPTITRTELIDPLPVKEISEAPSGQVNEKQAARLVVIRRRKMKKHKLRKLRKKMKFVWLKIIQKREYKKEKDFQAEQMAIVREAEAFDAAKYVEDVLKKVNTKHDSKYFKGKRLPVFIVKELKEKQKIKRKLAAQHKIAIAEMMEEIQRKGLMKGE